jgi:Ca-activated chloride channel family protein
MSALQTLSELHFLRPLWLWALPLALLPWLLRRRRQATISPWSALVDRELLPHLLVSAQTPRSAGSSPLVALLLLGVLALAGPAFRLLPQSELSREAGLVIALDLSAGMLAADLPPDRLSRARFEIADLLRQRGDGQAALVAYAGEAFTVAPLTDDAATLEALLGALAPEVMPVPGQRVERALALAARLLDGAGQRGGEILLVSHAGGGAAEPLAATLAERGIRTSLLILGSDAGAPIPQPGGGFRSGADGALLLAPRDLDSAAALAAAGQGILVEARGDDADTRRLLQFWEHGQTLRGERRAEAGALRYADEGPWLALIALLPALLLLRRSGAPLLLVLALGALSRPAEVVADDGLWDALWARPEQRAWQALEQGDPERARALVDSGALAAAAAYRAKDYPAAAQGYAQGKDAVSLYNRGTALAQAGQLEAALQSLDAALALDPKMEDARYNRERVAEALQQQRDASQAQSGEPPGQEAGEASPADPSPAADRQPRQAGEPGTGDHQGSSAADHSAAPEFTATAAQPDQAKAREDATEAQRQAVEQALAEAPASAAGAVASTPAEAISDAEREQRQASEQLLRRIQDDPGALLRRKFALEQRRRVLEGDSR